MEGAVPSERRGIAPNWQIRPATGLFLPTAHGPSLPTGKSAREMTAPEATSSLPGEGRRRAFAGGAGLAMKQDGVICAFSGNGGGLGGP